MKLIPYDALSGVASSAQGDKADTAAQPSDIGTFYIVKNRVDNERQVNDFAGASFTDKMIDALQNTMENNLTLVIPDGSHLLETLITLNGTTATRRIVLKGASQMSTRIRCQGGKLRINLTAWGQFEASNLWFDPVGEQVGNAPLYVYWNGMASSRGFKIYDCQFGATNAEDNVTNWFENLVRLDGKGTGLITKCHFMGKSDLAPVTNGLQIDNAKEVDINLSSWYHMNKALFSAEGATSISEGIKLTQSTMVNVNHGVWLESAPTLPDMEVQGCHIAYNRSGIKLKNWSQVKILNNLIYAEANSLETAQDDIILDTCPFAIVDKNSCDSGLDKSVVQKNGLTLIGSSRNSQYLRNLFSERTIGIKLMDNGVSGVQDCVFDNNRPARDLAGAKTVLTMVDISNSALHARNIWRGEDGEFSSIMSNSITQNVAQNIWTTVVLGDPVVTTPIMAPNLGTNAGEYVVKQNGTTRARIKASLRLVPAASANAGTVGLRLMRHNGSGFVEIERVSSSGTDVALNFTSADYVFNSGNQFRIEAFQSAAGNGVIQVGAKMEFIPIK